MARDIEPRKFLVGRPNIGSKQRLYDRLDKIFESHWLTNDGDYVRQLESQLADYLGVKHCVAMCNGTVALELAIRATGMSGKVIVPSMTFVATAHALKWQEIEPVFVDIDSQSHNLDPDAIKRGIDEHTTGIIGVHLYGRPCDINALQLIAEEYQLKLIFDAAHAFGCSYQGQKVGRYGNCEVFSFHATKVFNTFEGGAVTTDDDELASKLRLMRNFGFEGEDNVSYVGTNGKMAEVNAAMGLTNLEELDHFIDVNKRNYQSYQDGLVSESGVALISYDNSEHNNYQYVIITIDDALTGYSRDQLKEFLTGHGIIARRYFYPGCHRMEPYKTLYPEFEGTLPVSDTFSQKMLALPTGTQIDESKILEICRLICSFKRA